MPARGEFALIQPQALIYYRDTYDHIVRIEELNQVIRDRADNALALYLSSMAICQNEIIKLPPTLLVGVYGMNSHDAMCCLRGFKQA